MSQKENPKLLFWYPSWKFDLWPRAIGSFSDNPFQRPLISLMVNLEWITGLKKYSAGNAPLPLLFSWFSMHFLHSTYACLNPMSISLQRQKPEIGCHSHSNIRLINSEFLHWDNSCSKSLLVPVPRKPDFHGKHCTYWAQAHNRRADAYYNLSLHQHNLCYPSGLNGWAPLM